MSESFQSLPPVVQVHSWSGPWIFFILSPGVQELYLLPFLKTQWDLICALFATNLLPFSHWVKSYSIGRNLWQEFGIFPQKWLLPFPGLYYEKRAYPDSFSLASSGCQWKRTCELIPFKSAVLRDLIFSCQLALSPQKLVKNFSRNLIHLHGAQYLFPIYTATFMQSSLLF